MRSSTIKGDSSVTITGSLLPSFSVINSSKSSSSQSQLCQKECLHPERYPISLSSSIDRSAGYGVRLRDMGIDRREEMGKFDEVLEHLSERNWHRVPGVRMNK